MAYITVTNTLVNGNTADAGELNTNFTDIINGTSDGSKDLNVAALTCAGNVTFNGNTTIGNATSDTVTFTARSASDFLPSADDTYDLGSSSLQWADIRGVLGTFTGLLTAESGIKPSSASDALTYYSYDEYTLDGAFTGSFKLKCCRIGNTVTISTEATPTHSGPSASASSNNGLLASQYRPTNSMYNIYLVNSSGIFRAVVTSAGAFGVAYFDYTGSGTNRSDTGTAVLITYNV
jgi:hypothetical protein